MTVSRLLGILVLALAFLPAQALAHLKLASSTPAHGDTVRTPVSEIVLNFTEAVEASFTTIVVIDAFGRELAVGTSVRAVGGARSQQYVVMFDTPIAGGAFTVSWKVVGKDGHAVNGMFDFVVDTGQPAPATPGITDSARLHAPAHGGHQSEATEIPPLYRPESSIAWIFARWLNFCALLLIVGTVAFRFGVLERAKHVLGEALVVDVDANVRRFAITAAALAILSNLLRLWLQSGSIHGPERMFQSDLLFALILKGGWGRAWLAQTLAAVAFIVAAAIRTEDRSDSWLTALPIAVVAASASAFTGHAAAVQQLAIVPIVDDAIHIMAASAWLGTRAVLLFAAMPRVVRADDGFVKLAKLVNIFSPLALTMAIITVFTGTVSALVQLHAISDLWATPYGRILALKIGVVLLAITIGAYNWRIVKPSLGTEVAAADLKRSARTEVMMAVLILVLTAVLVATPPGSQ
ncbi:MAG: copper resistance CopC/CopD family protein [Gemmatimonadota bacterium]